MPTPPRDRRDVGSRLAASLLPALALALIAGGRLGLGVPVHVDEPSWVASSYYFELLAAGDRRHADWQLLPAIESPPVGKYLFGMALRAADRPIRTIDPLASTYERYRAIPGAWGIDPRQPIPGRYDPDRADAFVLREAVADRLDEATKAAVQAGSYRPIDAAQLRACRALALGFGVLCAAGIGSIGAALRGPRTGVLAGLLFAVHPLAVEAATLALFDIIALAFSVLTIRLLIALTAADGWRRPLALGVLTGVALALAVGTKLNALVLVPVLLVVAAGALVRRRPVGVHPALPPVITLAVAARLFVAINPALDANPLRGVEELFRIPAQTVRVQAGFLPDHLTTPAAKAATVGALLCGHKLGLIPLLAVALGPIALGLRTWSPRSVVALWFLAALAAVVAWIPFPWPRYALPALPPAVLLTADAVAGAVSYSRKFPSEKRITPPTA